MADSNVVFLERILKSFQHKNAFKLRENANALIASAAATNNTSLATLSVVAYSLSKLLAKTHFQKRKTWTRFEQTIQTGLVRALLAAKKQDAQRLTAALETLTQKISQTDFEFSHYWQNLVEKARVKQASSAYAFGLSLSQACQLTRCDKNELFSYIGYTRMHEETPVIKSISERVNDLQKLAEESR